MIQGICLTPAPLVRFRICLPLIHDRPSLNVHNQREEIIAPDGGQVKFPAHS
jgi:hypothetical protein